ncbi:tmem176a [Pungitius sinensis]
MSVAVVKDEGVTAVAAATDSKSLFPPLCQILKTLCCSGAEVLMERDVTAALGTMQIMVGLFNIGLGPGRPYMRPDSLTFMGASYWLGGVFSVAGVVSILAGRSPSLYLVGFAVLVNVVGSLSAVVAVVQSSLALAAAPAAGMCDGHAAGLRNDNCIYVAHYVQRLLTALDVTLIVLAVLHLCVSISFAALGIKAVVNRKGGEVVKDDEDQHLLMKEGLLTNPAA